MNDIIRIIGELLFIDNVGAFIRYIRYNICERRRISYRQLMGACSPKTKDQKEITKHNDENFLYGFVFLFLLVSSIGIYQEVLYRRSLRRFPHLIEKKESHYFKQEGNRIIIIDICYASHRTVN